MSAVSFYIRVCAPSRDESHCGFVSSFFIVFLGPVSTQGFFPLSFALPKPLLS
jgi:hypothetical protein